MADIFLSYDKEDLSRVMPLVRALRRRRWTVWWDRSILPSEVWEDVIEEELDKAKCVVVVWSERSVKSKWVKTEASEGRERGILVPALIDKVKLPLGYKGMQAADLMDWQGEKGVHPGLNILLKAIRKTLTSSRAAGETTAAKEKAETPADKPKPAEAAPAAEAAKKPATSAKKEAGDKEQDEGNG